MPTLLEKLFPLHRIRNITLFYILSIVINLWFIAGVWVFIWTRFMTNSQLGIADAITLTAGFLVELPSGVFADIIGRRKAILIGSIMLTVGNLCISFSSSFWSITFFYFIWTVGYAFQSGATEALAYDTLKQKKLEHEWGKVIATSTVLGRTASLLATAIGGFVFSIWFRLPYFIFGVTGIVGIIAAFLLHEIQVKRKIEAWSFRLYAQQIMDGVRVLSKPYVLPIASFCLMIGSILYLYDWGLLRPLTALRFGFTPETFPLLLSSISIIEIIIMFLYSKLISSKYIIWGILFAGCIFVIANMLIGFNHSMLVGGVILLMFMICSTVVQQLFSQFINKHTESKHRATTLSAIALFTRVPYVLLAAFIGYLADQHMLPMLSKIIGIVLCVVFAVTVSVIISKKNLYLKT